MANQFTGSIVGDLENYFVNDYATIDQFANTGSLWRWGDNAGGGPIGDNTEVGKSSPVQTIGAGPTWKQASGNQHSAAVKTDGTLWTWGFNFYGTLGTNTTTNRSSPGQTIAAGTNWKQVSCGKESTHAIKTNGTLWSWGRGFTAPGNAGLMGDNTIVHRSSPVQTIAAGTNWKQVSAGGCAVAAVKTDGTLWIWGGNFYYQLGNNSSSTALSVSSPIQTVAGGTNWKQVAIGHHIAGGVKTDGTLWMWGWNNSGQCGNGVAGLAVSSPVQTIAGGTNWKQLSCGQDHSAAIKTDGTLWLWGKDGETGYFGGALGTGTTLVNKSSPVQTIAGGTNWKQAVAGTANSAAIKTDGTLWLWGDVTYGVLGGGSPSSTHASSPVQTIAAGTNWKSVDMAISGYHIGAIYFYDANNLYPK